MPSRRDTLQTAIRPLLLLTLALSLTHCVSFEPRVLAPSITFSAEDLNLNQNTDNTAAIDFGVDSSLNESDSLSNIEVLPGIRVRSVDSNGAAASAGIQTGDVILSIDGMETNHPDTLTALQTSGRSGEYLFRVRRNTAVLEATVTPRVVSENSLLQELYRVDPIASRAGYRTEMISVRNQPQLPAARIVELFPGSPLPAAGISLDEWVLAIDGRKLNSAQDLVTSLNQNYALGDTVVMSIYDGQSVNDVSLRLWNPGRRLSEFTLWPMWTYDASLTPAAKSFNFIDLIIWSVYSFDQREGERSHNLLGLFKFSSAYGELVEE